MEQGRARRRRQPRRSAPAVLRHGGFGRSWPGSGGRRASCGFVSSRLRRSSGAGACGWSNASPSDGPAAEHDGGRRRRRLARFNECTRELELEFPDGSSGPRLRRLSLCCAASGGPRWCS